MNTRLLLVLTPFSILWTSLLMPPRIAAQEPDSPPRRLAVVGGASPGALAILELSSFELLRTVEGLQEIHGAAVSPDGGRAYALSLSDAEHAISVIDVPSGEVVDVVGLDAPAHHAAMDPSGKRLYLTWGFGAAGSETPRGIAAFDPETGSLVNIRPEGTPYYPSVSPDGAFLYATTMSPDLILKIALPDFQVVARGAIDGSPSHIAVTEDGRTLFVTLASGGVAKVDAGTLEILRAADTGPDAHAVALAGDPVRVFVANRGSSTLTVLDPATLETIEQIESPPVPSHMIRLPGGDLLISAAGSREVVKLDPNTLEIVGRIALPMQPHQSWAPPG
jgi:YVTN family beta-propeller protein